MEEERIINEIEQKIEKKRKMPQEIESKLNKKIFENLLMAIVIMLYFNFFIFGINNIEIIEYIKLLKIFTLSIGVLSIIVLEYSYKKESVSSMYTGIELIALSIITMFCKYICIINESKYIPYLALFAYVFSIYYIFKDIIIYRKTKKEYLKSLNDKEEIIKKEKPQKVKNTTRKRK